MTKKEQKPILIKSFFTDWHEVDRETAKDYILYLLANMPAIKGRENKIKYLQDRKIKGISINELIGE